MRHSTEGSRHALGRDDSGAGPFGYLALALGGLGFALGFFALIALLGKTRAGHVNSSLDKERIMRQGHKEVQSSSWPGLFAALVFATAA